MTSQTIGGVPREVLEQALLDAQRIRFPEDKQIVELRALLDAHDALHSQPADATHYYPKVACSRKWRKQIEGAWHEWCGGKWLPLDHAMVDDYAPVTPLAAGSAPCAKSQGENADGQGQVKRTYLVSYTFQGGGGRTFHRRDTDDAPTMENIESMEINIAKKNGLGTVTILSISQLGNSNG